jgi:hypothetical protein
VTDHAVEPPQKPSDDKTNKIEARCRCIGGCEGDVVDVVIAGMPARASNHHPILDFVHDVVLAHVLNHLYADIVCTKS